MAGKLLKSTDEKQVKRKTRKKDIEEENIYKINFEEENLENQEKQQIEPQNERKSRNKNVIKVLDDEEEEIDEIFGNVNKWITDDNLEEDIKKQKEKKTRKKRLTKIEEGIKSSKVTEKSKKTTTKSKTAKKKKEEIPEINIIEQQETTEDLDREIKIHAENGVTEILLKHNKYKIELQKTEYNIYTDNSETSYIIVRDPGLRMISREMFLLVEKQGEDYEVTTNQDFKINYIIDNLTRKNNTVNFKLTNLTEIVANEEGLIFEIDEEKVIENNLEDNHTLVISEEDGKVYLPYTKEDVKKAVGQNKGTKISEVIENKYILPLDKYKNSIRARFREGYNLMYKREGKSKKSAILLGIELMFETNLHPAIISACKNLEELDIYLDCLEDNELEKFSCFKIIYKSLPTLRKKAKFQEF